MSLFCLAALGLNGCTEPASKIEIVADENKEAIERLQTTETLKPLNCPVILDVIQKEKGRFRDHSWVNISFIKNPDFDASLGDACQGDMKNIWQDLKRFDVNSQYYRVHLNAVEFFPKTAKNVKNFIDATTIEYRLDYKLDQIDRTTALGRNQVKGAMGAFYGFAHRSYWLTEHAYIIDGLLSESDLHVKFWSSEKPSYCYARYERCICYTERETCKKPREERERISGQSYNFEYFPKRDYGELIFTKPEPITQE